MNEQPFQALFIQVAPGAQLLSQWGSPHHDHHPPPVFKGSSETLLYPFGPASHFACDKFVYTYVWPLPHLKYRLYNQSSSLTAVRTPALPSPSTPQGKHRGFPLPWGLCDTDHPPASAAAAAVGCSVGAPFTRWCRTPQRSPSAERQPGPRECRLPGRLWIPASISPMTSGSPRAGHLASRRDPRAVQPELQGATRAGLGACRLRQDGVLLSHAPAHLFTRQLLRALPPILCPRVSVLALLLETLRCHSL